MWEVGTRAYRRQSTYRGATLAGAVTNTVFGFILAYVLLAVFRERSTIGGFDATDAVTFTFVTQGLLMVVGVFGAKDISDRIRTGDVITDLYRPVDFQLYWLADKLGGSAYYVVFRGVPPFAVASLAFHLRLPASALTWVEFAVATLLAVVVAFGWGFLLQLTAFWLLDVRGSNQLGWLGAQFFAGVFVPIVFFPAWLFHTAQLLPFPSLVQLPSEVFLEKHTGIDVVGVYAQQAFWALVLLMAGRAVLARAMQKVVVQGG
jgi:ABC-2 type transport system permease protein